MKLSEVRSCDNCKGVIAPAFYILDISQALFTPETNKVVAMTQYFEGHLHLAEMFVGEPDVVLVFGDEDPRLKTRIFLCQTCTFSEGVDIPSLLEKVNERLQKIEDMKAELEKEG